MKKIYHLICLLLLITQFTIAQDPKKEDKPDSAKKEKPKKKKDLPLEAARKVSIKTNEGPGCHWM